MISLCLAVQHCNTANTAGLLLWIITSQSLRHDPDNYRKSPGQILDGVGGVTNVASKCVGVVLLLLLLLLFMKSTRSVSSPRPPLWPDHCVMG